MNVQDQGSNQVTNRNRVGKAKKMNKTTNEKKLQENEQTRSADESHRTSHMKLCPASYTC